MQFQGQVNKQLESVRPFQEFSSSKKSLDENLSEKVLKIFDQSSNNYPTEESIEIAREMLANRVQIGIDDPFYLNTQTKVNQTEESMEYERVRDYFKNN